MPKAFPPPRAAALVAAVVVPLLHAAPALAAAHARATPASERTPVDLTGGAGSQGAHVGSGGSIVRTIVGLAVVIGVIYGVAWVLKQVKASKQERSTGAGLASVASAPLGAGRSVHLVRAGREFVLVGVGEHGVTPLRAYDEQQARAAGLLDEEGELLLPAEPIPVRRGEPRKLPLPEPRQALDALKALTVRR